MCKWPAVNGVVLSAIRSGKFSDDEIRAALLRLAAENRSVTIDSLRTELVGFVPQGRAVGRRQQETDATFDRAMQRAEMRESQ
jgi:predicted kinase